MVLQTLNLSSYRGIHYVCGSTNQPLNGGTTPPESDYDQGVQRNRGFSSPHAAGVQFALGDGSVRLISENIDETTYRLLGSCADGKVVDGF